MEPLSAERKFVAPASAVPQARALLGHLLLPDAEFPADTVSSIYFDSPGLPALHEKLDGDHLQAKVRLRWYGRPGGAGGTVPGFLERKERIGSARRKTRCRVAVPRRLLEADPWDEEGLRALLTRHARDLGIEQRPDLSPVALVRYERARYVCPISGARVSLDTDIRLARVGRSGFGRRRSLGLGLAVLEVKTRGREEPPWLHRLAAAGFRSRSFSKYGALLEALV